MPWNDDVTLKLYISESGDFVSLGTRTEIPLTPAGNGLPYGSTLYAPNGHETEVNFTTASGRFSISNKTADAQTNRIFGAHFQFEMQLNTRYIMNVQAQVMDGKQAANRYVQNGRVVNGTAWGVSQTAVTPWEDIALYSDFTVSQDFMYVRLMATNTNPANTTWGVQYQNLAMITIPTNVPAPVWHEVTCDINAFSLREGRERATNRYEVGQAVISVINDNGEFTYQPTHPWGLRPGRFVKVEATHKGITYPVYYGLIDGMTNSYTIDGHALTNMACVDVSSLLANQTVPGMSNAETMQLSGTRFNQMLNGVAWHPSQTDWQQGSFYMRGITANGRTVRDELGLIGDSEGSYFWADRVGKLFYRGRDWNADRITMVGAELLAQLPNEPEVFPYVNYVFPGAPNNDMQVPDSAELDMLGGIDITARLSFDNVNGSGQMIVAKNDAGSNGWWLYKAATNRRLVMRAGRTTITATVDMPAVTSTGTFWVKAQYNATTGSVRFYYYYNQDTEPLNNEWIAIGAEQFALTTGQVATTDPMFIGNSNFSNPLAGRIRELIIRPGTSNSTPIFHLKESDGYGKAGTLAFNASTGQPITVRQTGTNVIVRDASVYEYLPVVDDIPTLPTAPMICTNALDTTWSRDRVINELSLANVGGSAITTIDAESQKKYGPRTYSRMDLLNDNAHPEYLDLRAADLMHDVTEASIRVNSVSFNPAINKDGWVWALTCFMNDLVRVRYTHPTEGWGFSAVAHIQGIEHSIDTKQWRTRLALDDYEAFVYYDFAEIQSGWDIGLWDEDIWDGAGNPNTPAYWNAKYLWSNANSKWG